MRHAHAPTHPLMARQISPLFRPVLGDPANPRNTITAWLSLTISSSSNRPIRSPHLDFGTVVILSTISLAEEWSPLRSFGSTGSRNRGACAGSVVKEQMVIESV